MVSKRYAGMSVALIALVIGLCATASAVEFAGGTGEPNDPYQIATAEQLIAIGSDPNLLDRHFVLVSDIDLDPNLPGGRLFDTAVISAWLPPGATWDPNRPFFNGTFDGNDHAIRNLAIEGTPGQEKVGLFGYVHWYGSIRNLRLESVRIQGGYGVGGLVGQCAGALVACRVTGSVHGDEAVGLLAGFCHGSAQDCLAEGIVSGQTEVGGLIGYSTAVVTGCESGGQVQGENSVGGLIGISRDRGRVVTCASRATVVGTRSVGGLVGRNGGQIIDSFVDASVSGQDSVGGLVGENGFTMADIGSMGTVAYCYALGQVSGREKTGGLVGSLGSSSQIEECYAANRPVDSMYSGGLVGFARTSGTKVLRSFWDMEISRRAGVYGGTGLTTAQMQDPNTFIQAGWDFPGSAGGPLDRWTVPAQGGYPVLVWQLSPSRLLPTFAGGTGPASDPFLIATAEQLNSIADHPLLMGSHFALVEDISLAGEPFWPIGSRLFPFTGTFDGQGRTISGLMVRRDAGDNVGMFGVVDGYSTQIRNIVLAGPRIEAPASENVGALAGYVSAELLAKCTVTDANVIGGDCVGGLVGYNSRIVSDCHVDGTVSANHSVGGLVGYNGATIERCAALCATSGDSLVGGLVGSNRGSVMSSFASGVTSGTDWVGGLAGGGDGLGTFEQCFATGAVTGDRHVGGLVGECWCAITSCYARTDVTGRSQVGGLVGEKFAAFIISQCYFAGSLTGQDEFGALIGSTQRDASITSCFWDAALAGTKDGIGNVEPDPATVSAKATADMSTVVTFLNAGWDFDTIWTICEGKDYPRLRWEGVECDAGH